MSDIWPIYYCVSEPDEEDVGSEFIPLPDMLPSFLAGFSTSGSFLPTLSIVAIGNRSDGTQVSVSRAAQWLTNKDSDINTIIAIHISHPGRKSLADPVNLARMAEKSHVSVLTRDLASGKVHVAVRRESLSTLGGKINLWLSDLVMTPQLLEDPKTIRPADA